MGGGGSLFQKGNAFWVFFYGSQWLTSLFQTKTKLHDAINKNQLFGKKVTLRNCEDDSEKNSKIPRVVGFCILLTSLYLLLLIVPWALALSHWTSINLLGNAFYCCLSWLGPRSIHLCV